MVRFGVLTTVAAFSLGGCATDPMIVTANAFKECTKGALAVMDDGKLSPETMAAMAIKRCDREQTASIAPMLVNLNAAEQIKMTAHWKRQIQGIMTGNVIEYRLRKEQRPHAL